MLWLYGVGLMRASKGNTFNLNIRRPTPRLQPRFKRCYICFDGTKKALNVACRPFIGLNGYHLKNKYGRIFFIVVGRDANDQYLPIAFGVVDNETRASLLSYFLMTLVVIVGGTSYLISKSMCNGPLIAIMCNVTS